MSERCAAVYNGSARSRRTPIATQTLSNRPQRCRCLKKSSLAAKGAKVGHSTRRAKDARVEPPREASRARHRGCLLTGNCPCRPLAAPKPTPWGARMALPRVESSPPHPSRPPKASPGRGQPNAH